ncbi:DUF3502 domain-containing protein [Paenibacillus sp. LMG 31461]|uniref:DUF3502 domain-containing protein n=1 Tax=Paenibacillus plantarum TaxID=2654975 RepID=A0ABX1X857_9BACL|nr:ABC transporter substrate-binding protein [Paenibacillus plantarum]NOU64635.1 DUF3502 domain-containing protein [Paenibacillus plantarum]
MKKRMYGYFMLCLSLILVLSACSSSSPEQPKPSDAGASTKEKTLPPVELSWYLPGNPQTDIASVEKAVNDYIQPKINATLKISMIPSASYPEKMNTLLASNEALDLLWTANYSFLYENNAKKGAFTELSKLLPQYAPNLQKSLPALAWEDSKLQGELYAVPNYQIAAKVYGFSVQKRYVDKYGLDTSKIKTFKDLEPFLDKIKQNEPNAIPYTASTSFRYQMYGYTGVNDTTFYKSGDKSYKVVELVDTPEYLEFHKMLHDWYTKGYINKDIATADNSANLTAGKIVSKFDQTLKPGGEFEEKLKNGGNDVVYIPLSAPEFTGVQATMTAISRTSKNPERAMMFLELVNTDSTLFNILAYGVEGKHYEKMADNKVKVKKDGGYVYTGWRIGNVMNGYLLDGQADNTWELTKKMNETAVVPEIFGFKFDSSNVKAEVANVAAVRKEFMAAIETGTVDPNEYVPKYREALKKSGNDKILAEQQKQLDAWLKEKGKK